MKRQDLVEMKNEYQFRSLLTKSKISDDQKVGIIRDRQRYLWQMFTQGRPVETETGVKAEMYRDPLTNRLRFNTER